MRDLSQLAASVLAEVEQGQTVKQAAAVADQKTLQTDTGKMLQKIAEQLRHPRVAQITYADLEHFRKTYAV